jgi:hypothetical protein
VTGLALVLTGLALVAAVWAYLVVTTPAPPEYILEPDVYLSDATWCELCGTFVHLTTAAEVFAHLHSHAPDTAEVVEP